MSAQFKTITRGWRDLPAALTLRAAPFAMALLKNPTTGAGEAATVLEQLSASVHRIGAVGLGAVPVEAPRWLEDVYSFVERRDHESAGRLIFEQVNELLAGDGFSRCNDLLHAIDLKRLDTYSVVAVLSITLAAATSLPYRERFVTRATARLKELAPSRVDRLLAGLK